MSIRGFVKKIFPQEAWPYLQIPYRMCWAVRRKVTRAFTSGVIIRQAEEYIPFYQDDLSLEILKDRLEFLRSNDDGIFLRRAQKEGWRFHEVYGVDTSKYSGVTLIYDSRSKAEYTASLFEMTDWPGRNYKLLTLSEFLGGSSVNASELLVLAMTDWNILRVRHCMDKNGLANDTLNGIAAMREEVQYVDVFSPVKDEVIVDAGAYTGDTALRFLRYAPDLRKIYSFEPDPANAARLQENLKDFAGTGRITLIPKGTWDKNETLRYSSNGSGSAITEDGCSAIDLTTIDSVVGDEKVTFIKMDVEGAELKSLMGARRTITRNHPRLAVCVYHKRKDLYEIPGYILSIVPEYRFYLRHYSSCGFETVLYAEVPVK